MSSMDTASPRHGNITVAETLGEGLHYGRSILDEACAKDVRFFKMFPQRWVGQM